MTYTETLGPGGVPIITIDSTAGNTTYPLPAGYASGRKLIVRRKDSTANTATVTVVTGGSINGTTNGTVTIPRDSEVEFQVADNNAWESYGDPDVSATLGPAIGSNNWLKAWAPTVADDGAVGAITIDGNGVATGYTVSWPDGTSGTFTATTVNSTWLTVDAWTLTYAGSTTKTVTQAAVTRDATTGSVTNQPALAVS
jgi:hypothetical protein